MPYLVFDDDETKTPHVLKGLDTAPPRAVIELQRETGWELKRIRDEAQGADFTGALISAYLTVRIAARPVTWDFLMDTPMHDWPWSTHATQAEIDAAEKGEETPGDAVDPLQPSPPSSEADDGTEAEEWPPQAD